MNRLTRILLAASLAWVVVAPVHAADHEVKIDINKASLEDFIKLPRIGPAVAQRIVEYRKQNGGFRKLEDLRQVKGIGQKTFDLLKDKITVGDPSRDPAAR